MDEIIKGAKQYIKGSCKVIFATADGQYFYDQGYAMMHAGPKKLKCISITLEDLEKFKANDCKMISLEEIEIDKVSDPLMIPSKPIEVKANKNNSQNQNSKKNRKRNGNTK